MDFSDLSPKLPEEIIEACKSLKTGERNIFILHMGGDRVVTDEDVRKLSTELTTKQDIMVEFDPVLNSVTVFKMYD